MTYYKTFKVVEVDWTSAAAARDAKLEALRAVTDAWCKSSDNWIDYSEDVWNNGLDMEEGRKHGGWPRYSIGYENGSVILIDNMYWNDGAWVSAPIFSSILLNVYEETPLRYSDDDGNPQDPWHDWFQQAVDIWDVYWKEQDKIVNGPVQKEWDERLAWYRRERDSWQYERKKDEIRDQIKEIDALIKKIEKEIEQIQKEINKLGGDDDEDDGINFKENPSLVAIDKEILKTEIEVHRAQIRRYESDKERLTYELNDIGRDILESVRGSLDAINAAIEVQNGELAELEEKYRAAADAYYGWDSDANYEKMMEEAEKVEKKKEEIKKLWERWDEITSTVYLQKEKEEEAIAKRADDAAKLISEVTKKYQELFEAREKALDGQQTSDEEQPLLEWQQRLKDMGTMYDLFGETMKKMFEAFKSDGGGPVQKNSVDAIVQMANQAADLFNSAQ